MMGTEQTRNRLGVDAPIEQLAEVVMKVEEKARMGISFWPTFSFTPSDSETQYGSVHTMDAAEQKKAAAALAEVAAKNASKETGSATPDQRQNTDGTAAADGTATAHGTAAGSSQATVGNGTADAPSSSGRLLSVVFTKDGKPLKEFKVGASFLCGIPFPFISISTTKLEGTVDPDTGKVELLFQAKFLSQIGSWVGAELTVDTLLTTEEAEACGKKRKGERLQDGRCKLIAVAKIPSTGNRFADFILWLPTAATAELPTHLYLK